MSDGNQVWYDVVCVFPKQLSQWISSFRRRKRSCYINTDPVCVYEYCLCTDDVELLSNDGAKAEILFIVGVVTAA